MKNAVRKRVLPGLQPIVAGLIFVLCLTTSAVGQAITQKQTLTYLNQKLEGKCEFTIKKGYLLVTFLKGEDPFRIDRLSLRELDPDRVVYDKEEESVYVYCGNDLNDCVKREIKHLKKIDYYGRFNLIVKGMDTKSIMGIKEALIHLIKLDLYSDHERTQPFE
jgi:hypothetical protein